MSSSLQVFNYRGWPRTDPTYDQLNMRKFCHRDGLSRKGALRFSLRIRCNLTRRDPPWRPSNSVPAVSLAPCNLTSLCKKYWNHFHLFLLMVQQSRNRGFLNQNCGLALHFLSSSLYANSLCYECSECPWLIAWSNIDRPHRWRGLWKRCNQIGLRSELVLAR